jgi:hypothetical protein
MVVTSEALIVAMRHDHGARPELVDACPSVLLNWASSYVIPVAGEVEARELIDRANVGRATFYAHFDNKDDLLASGWCRG